MQGWLVRRVFSEEIKQVWVFKARTVVIGTKPLVGAGLRFSSAASFTSAGRAAALGCCGLQCYVDVASQRRSFGRTWESP